MIPLRVGIKEDYAYARSMAEKAITSYSLLPQDTLNWDAIEMYIYGFLDKTDGRIAIFSFENNVMESPVGCIALEPTYDLLNNRYVGVEKFLWVEPEFRNKGHITELLGAAEFWARKINMRQLQISRQETKNKELNKGLDKSYKKQGFLLRDYNYVKDLN